MRSRDPSHSSAAVVHRTSDASEFTKRLGLTLVFLSQWKEGRKGGREEGREGGRKEGIGRKQDLRPRVDKLMACGGADLALCLVFFF